MLNFKNIELKLQLEKMVIGLEEPILIKGGGKFIAKVDSGNAGYNVIHGEDLVQQGDILNFKTFDSDNNERRISKKIVDTLNVHIGAGNIQERPVIELDIKFADEDYKKVPFTVTDRSKNSEKVLISKDFVQNQLDALIDVSQVNMTEKEPVEVDYVNEGLKKFLSNHAKKDPTGLLHPINTIKQAGKNIANNTINAINHPIKSAKAGIEKATSFFDKLAHGADHFDSTSSNSSDELSNSVDKEISKLKEKIGSDARLIKNTASGSKDDIDKMIGLKSMKTSVTCNDLYVKRVLDYQGNLMYGKKLELPNNLADLYKQKENLRKNSTQQAAEKPTVESFIDKRLKEIYESYGLIYEDDNLISTSTASTTAPTLSMPSTTSTASVTPTQTVTDNNLTSTQQNDTDNEEKINEIDEKIKDLMNKFQNFRLYFVGGTVKNDKVVDDIESNFRKIGATYLSEAKKILNLNNLRDIYSSAETFCINMSNALNSKNKDGNFVGYFAIVFFENDCSLFIRNDNYVVKGGNRKK